MYPIHETAQDTAGKIKELLTAAYPGFPITVSASQNMISSKVHIDWIDGPLESVVKQQVGFMCDYSDWTSNGCTDGYEWEGKRYLGANYVVCHRVLSSKRRKLIKNCLVRRIDPDDNGSYTVEQWEEAERYLMIKGEIEGAVSPDSVPLDNLVPFPKDVTLTPDQALKFKLLDMLFHATGVRANHVLVKEGKQIDELFTYVAHTFFNNK